VLGRQLLGEASVPLRLATCATLANLVLDFSPLKVKLCDSGVVAALVQCTIASSSELRAMALAALKNVVYKAEPPIRNAVVRELGYPRLCTYDGRLTGPDRFSHPSRTLRLYLFAPVSLSLSPRVWVVATGCYGTRCPKFTRRP
jgi:hypothetical protein